MDNTHFDPSEELEAKEQVIAKVREVLQKEEKQLNQVREDEKAAKKEWMKTVKGKKGVNCNWNLVEKSKSYRKRINEFRDVIEKLREELRMHIRDKAEMKKRYNLANRINRNKSAVSGRKFNIVPTVETAPTVQVPAATIVLPNCDTIVVNCSPGEQVGDDLDDEIVGEYPRGGAINSSKEDKKYSPFAEQFNIIDEIIDINATFSDAYPRSAKYLLGEYISILTRDTYYYKRLEEENAKLKNQLIEAKARLKLLNIANSEIMKIKEHMRINKREIEKMEGSVSPQQRENLRLLKLEELKCYIDFIEDHMKSLQAIYQNSPILLPNNTPPYAYSEIIEMNYIRKLNVDKKIKLRVLMSELKEKVISDFKVSVSYKQELLNRDKEIEFLKHFVDTYIEHDTYVDNCGKEVMYNKLDIDKVFKTLEDTEIHAIQRENDLMTMGKELEALNETYREHNNDFGIMRDIMQHTCKMLNNLQSRKYCRKIDELERARILIKDDQRTIPLIKCLHDKLCKILTKEYREKLRIYEIKLDTLEQKREINDDEVKYLLYQSLKISNEKRNFKRQRPSKFYPNYVHIKDVITVFNRTMRKKPEYMALMQEIGSYLQKQSIRWECYLNNTSRIMSFRQPF